MKKEMNKPVVRLTGSDGNAFAIMGKVRRALKKAGYSQDDIEEYIDDATSGDYNHLLKVTDDWVEIE